MPDAIAGWKQQLDQDLRAYTELARKLGHRVQVKLNVNGTGQVGDAQVNITVLAHGLSPKVT